MAETQAGLSQEQAGAEVVTPQAPVAGQASAEPDSLSASVTATVPPAQPGEETADPPELAAAAADEQPAVGAIHHIELWVSDLDRAVASWGWLLTALGYRLFQDWPGGRSWRAGHTYIVVEQSPARTAGRHDRCRPGLNHLAFHVGSREQADDLTREARLHGWKLMFTDLHPYAGGPQHYAAYLENADGFEVELVAR